MDWELQNLDAQLKDSEWKNTLAFRIKNVFDVLYKQQYWTWDLETSRYAEVKFAASGRDYLVNFSF